MAIIPPDKDADSLRLRTRVSESLIILSGLSIGLLRLDSRRHSVTMVQRMRLEQAYPEIRFRWRSRNWWARLVRMPAECEHLEHDGAWMATFIPDTLYLRGKASLRRQPARPEVSLCLACLTNAMQKELPAFR